MKVVLGKRTHKHLSELIKAIPLPSGSFLASLTSCHSRSLTMYFTRFGICLFPIRQISAVASHSLIVFCSMQL